MATQAQAVETATEIIPETNDNAALAERDFEAEAKSHGWVPKDEFKGDETRWVEAKTFVERADEVMPLLKKQNAHLKRELDDVKKSTRKIVDHFDKERQRLQAALEAKMEEAVETGDMGAFKRAKAESDALAKDAAKPEYTQAQAMDAYDGFREANPWYDRANLGSASDADVAARLYADRMTEKHVAKTAEMAPAEFFAYIEGLVIEKYPAVRNAPVRQKPASDVAGATNGRSPGPRGRTFNDLPQEAQRAADKWIKQGLLKDRAAYLASYQWDK